MSILYYKKKGYFLSFFCLLLALMIYLYNRKGVLSVSIPEGKTRKMIVVPIELYDQIKSQAKREHRNVSSLICYVMDQYIQGQRRREEE
jgi:hypothetical protein